ncbi:ribose 5-phosphate isomerase B [Gallibacterium anatis]|uniref:Ribose 5-phosphate isomerase n=3 Tax=Gallibacterium TaxID=155493 RepID=A0A0A2Y307_9PAST|nr:MULTISPECIES: ribose 5-phosphate isomerase B [Gallibacterium]KGQ39068.1 ribose 5-phosphate isomerase [Gallibacterium genomosp. 1]KGQ52713.1 ribose 5-phosphate isomerase [Gallibacterium anatis]KGQ61667.1 ribose 5-phosphate isomerase [Gallibacterium anatis 4895]KGQ63529.1 ribose 5-phosphate isomerase [Gallibacterium anatis]OBW97995.1 ribose 5-phosphate isomerase [Gallibacterium genomosp. 1]
MKIAIGCDEAAYNLKVELMKYLDSLGIEYDDFGAKAGDIVLYPDVAEAVALAVSEGKYERAILTCGTGIGMSITANKIPGVRAAVCHDVFSAERARKSNNAQIICFGERVIGVELAKYLLKTWLNCDFSGGGSTPKVAKINEIDQKYHKC